MIVVVVFLFAGCAGPRFKSEAQYNNGEWQGSAYLNEVAQIQNDKAQLAFNKEVGAMAIAKLKSQPVNVEIRDGVAQGYKGIVQNLSNYKNVQISIRHQKGYEVKSYVLAPGSFAEDYLLPGNYCVVYIVNGVRQKKEGVFTSGPRLFDYFGKKYHWHAYYQE
jgi:hypothetical protein